MSQQIPPLSSRFRKGFLVIGIVLLILGFLFFYLASRVNWDYVTTYKETVDISLPFMMSDYGFGNSFAFPTSTRNIEMQFNDYLTIECPDVVSVGQIRLTVYVVLFGSTSMLQYSKAQVLEYATSWVTHKNYQFNEFVGVYLAIPANQVPNNITILRDLAVSTTITLHHYETPQWVYFGAGVVLSSLALITMFRSRK